MGSQSPARPVVLRPGWARPAQPDQILPAELRHKHKHRMCLAGLPVFSSRSRGNQGKFLTKLQGPSKTMAGTKFSCEPRQGAGPTNGGCVPGGKHRAEQGVGLESGPRPVPPCSPRIPGRARAGPGLRGQGWAPSSEEGWASGRGSGESRGSAARPHAAASLHPPLGG